MADFIIAGVLILVALTGWVVVQHLARRYAAKHPEFGPAKEEGGGCGKGCHCSQGSCKNDDTQTLNHHKTMNTQERTP